MPISRDSFTPHGYLNNPYHTYRLNPSGVIRSIPAIGMGWHYPALHGGYNPRWLYRAFLRFAFVIDGQVYMARQDFKDAGVELRSHIRTGNLFGFRFKKTFGSNWVIITVGFRLLNENCLVSNVQYDGTSKNTSVRVAAFVDYERNTNWSRLMEYSIFVRHTPLTLPPPNVGFTIGSFPEGTAFHFLQIEQWPLQYVEGLKIEDLRDWLVSDGQNIPTPPSQPQEEESQIQLPRRVVGVLFKPYSSVFSSWKFILGRGETVRQAEANAYQAWTKIDGHWLTSSDFERDGKFWKNAPQLSGDWPDHIRRGVVYDFETLRMMVGQPAGIYKHKWDRMQLQGPRTVLAEAAVDMLALSYADPDTAKEVLFGTFADAPEPNVPCSREDGSYNMVAENGEACGTAPEWCFPFHCIEIVWRKTGDVAWLRDIYPHAAAYIEWWLAHRTKDDGGLFYFCSWEAGQDNSPRFGTLPSAGSDASHIRPSDLYAAVAQATRLLSQWAAILELDSSLPSPVATHCHSAPDAVREGQGVRAKWAAIADKYTAETRALWHDGWFYDYDARAATVSPVQDTMQLAPLLCGVATDEQRAALLPILPDPPKHGLVWHPLMWPSIAFCLIEACSEAGAFAVAAHHAWNIVDPVYAWMDSDPESVETKDGGLPGVGREYWPQVVRPMVGGGGAEVYGWGAIGVMFLIRHIVGFREARDGFSLTPNLPPVLLQPNKSYKIKPLHYHDARLSLRYVVGEDGRIAVRLIHIVNGVLTRFRFDTANGASTHFRRDGDTLVQS